MTTLDIILLICFIPAVWQGISKGLVKQLLGIAGLFIGAFLAYKFSAPLTEVLSPHLTDVQPKVVNALSCLLVFLASLLVFSLIGIFITKIFKFASLGFFNRILGALFGIFKAALLLSVLVCLFDELNARWEWVSAETLDASAVYTYLQDFGARFFPFIKQLFTNGNA